MGIGFYLGQPFAQHTLVAATLVAVPSGLIIIIEQVRALVTTYRLSPRRRLNRAVLG